jgi:hypothetical protein
MKIEQNSIVKKNLPIVNDILFPKNETFEESAVAVLELFQKLRACALLMQARACNGVSFLHCCLLKIQEYLPVFVSISFVRGIEAGYLA